MNLTSEHPYWAVRNGLLTTYPRLDRDLKCECAIIGGGITGALIGYHLVEAGVDTVILDRRDVGMGSTSASTGLLQYEVDTPLRALSEQVGADHANRSYLLCRDAIFKLEALARKHRIECKFERKPSLQLARYQNELPLMRREHELRRKLGLDVALWNRADIKRHFPFERPMALFSDDGAQVDPHALTHGLLAAAVKRGLRVFSGVNILRQKQETRGVRLTYEKGLAIRAKKSVVAGGYESKKFLSENSGQLLSTYALVSEPVGPVRGWYRQALIWETGQPYLYMRTLPDQRVIVGGEDEPFFNPTRRDCLIAAKTRTLVRKFARFFPDAKLEVAYAWAGTFAQTKDGLPYIGAPPRQPHTFFALGYGGNGITYSLIAAEIIRDALLGRRNRNAELFHFGR